MSDTITLTGVVATIPKVITLAGGVALTSFRLASNQRRYDRNASKWVDGDTNWYTVSAFRQLGTNAGASIHKGERVIVSGRMRIRDWSNGDRTGTSIDVEADSLGHDLTWGTTAFSRTTPTSTDNERDSFDPAPGGNDPQPAGSDDIDFGPDVDSDGGDGGADRYPEGTGRDNGAGAPSSSQAVVDATTAPGTGRDQGHDDQTPF